MKFFVTGLCMQGNKGGAAIALSLVDQLSQNDPSAEFVFAVPGGAEWTHEKRWAERYGFRVVQNVSLKDLVPPFSLSAPRAKRRRAWLKELRTADLMIQMSAICYVGPPSHAGTVREIVGSERVIDFALTKLVRRPMLGWTQSYGPLSTPFIRFMAREDLRRQPMVFCRGDDCLDAVKELLPRADAKSFPDVATVLPFDAQWGLDYVNQLMDQPKRFATISPSAVMYARHPGEGDSNPHVQEVREIVETLRAHEYQVLLVPHTYRPGRHNPRGCDFAVAQNIYRHFQDDSAVFLLREDLSPKELKSVISNAAVHIGARYHSMVAALSAGVPGISLSWHPKYRDLMREYGSEDFVLEHGRVDTLTSFLERINGDANSHSDRYEHHQSNIAARVQENSQLFINLAKGMTS